MRSIIGLVTLGFAVECACIQVYVCAQRDVSITFQFHVVISVYDDIIAYILYTYKYDIDTPDFPLTHPISTACVTEGRRRDPRYLVGYPTIVKWILRSNHCVNVQYNLIK